MSELYVGWNWKKYYTSAQIRKMQKQMKKSYKKAEKIQVKMEEKHKKDIAEAEDLLEKINFT